METPNYLLEQILEKLKAKYPTATFYITPTPCNHLTTRIQDSLTLGWNQNKKVTTLNYEELVIIKSSSDADKLVKRKLLVLNGVVEEIEYEKA